MALDKKTFLFFNTKGTTTYFRSIDGKKAIERAEYLLEYLGFDRGTGNGQPEETANPGSAKDDGSTV